jgi:hypothetical protein
MKLLDMKLAAVNLVLELEEQQRGDNKVSDSDGDGSHDVVDGGVSEIFF